MTSSSREMRAMGSSRVTSSSVKVGTCRLRFDSPRVMGIINVTLDSFSGDGVAGDTAAAVSRGKAMFLAGADIVDIGGESTRPGAEPVSIDAEARRTIGVVEALSAHRPGRISIDTYKPEVAEKALFAGASIINDVTGLGDPRMREMIAEHGASVVIMHMKGEPRTMQKSPRYKDVVSEVASFLQERVGAAEAAGISPGRIMVDPGIGFGKTADHNIEIISRLAELKALGKPIVIGVSRKSFIGKMTGLPPEERLEGSLAAAVLAVRNGADIVRAHDVAETVRALRVAAPILRKERELGGI
ncbi:MAG: Dihydropteroate synthase [Candidatus Thermoplasmatota archaeon]|nr:Dihydropteroate synthase [Candidatus Thermoplasmatota archaeon]